MTIYGPNVMAIFLSKKNVQAVFFAYLRAMWYFMECSMAIMFSKNLTADFDWFGFAHHGISITDHHIKV